jgi:predicted glutamine amidotransferase
MCRLFGMIAAEPIAAQFWLLGATDSMVDQSYRNPDGCGLAHYVGPRPVVEKHPIAAHEDREFAAEARSAHSQLFVAHVRHATRGEPRLENTQPFSRGNLVFAHNGTIDGLEDLPGSLGLFLGETDSERYFALLHHHIGEARDTITGIRKAVDWIEENCTYTSLNFLLADGDSLYALRLPGKEGLFIRRLEAEEDLRGLSSYGTRSEGHVPRGAVLFASERVDTAPSWRELEPGTLAVTDRGLGLELHHLV